MQKALRLLFAVTRSNYSGLAIATRTAEEGYATDMTHQQEIVRALLDKHAQKASESEYDRSVAISAISASRDIIQAVPTDLNGEEYAACLLSKLEKLLAGYHDPMASTRLARESSEPCSMTCNVH